MYLGEQLINLLGNAQSNVRIAAPFIKVRSLERALAAVPGNIGVTCITRWRPEDVASRVSDLEILDLLQPRDGATLLIHPHLHAKFFAADFSCLVGSANLTHTALGWRDPSNVEILVSLDTREHGLDLWWSNMLSSCIEATPAIRNAIAAQAEALKENGMETSWQQTATDDLDSRIVWIPECPRWTGLWEAYVGDEDKMPTSTLHAAKSDLNVLNIPPGLNEAEFQTTLRIIFRHTKIFLEIEALAKSGLSDPAAHVMLQSLCEIPEKDSSRRWRQLKDWLRALYPDEYRVETNQEVLLRGRNF